jgi:hypothetical protein
MAISRFQDGSHRLCQLRTVSFWPRWQALICTGRILGFMGPSKPSSLVTTLSNRTSLLWAGYMEGEWGSLGWRLSRASLGVKISSREQGSNFDLVGTSQMVVIRKTRGGSRVWRVGQVLPLQGVYRFESPWHSQIWVTACPLLSSRSMSGVLLMVRGWALLWLWLCYHDDYCITLPVTLIFCQHSVCLCML